MAQQVQMRRGTSSQHTTFTGAAGEMTINTDLNIAVVHDGSTVGGNPLVGTTASQTLTNKTLTAPAVANAAISGANNILSGTLTVTTGSIANGTFTNYTETTYSNSGIGATFTANLSLGTVQVLTLNNNCTFTMPTAAAGKSFVTILNSGTGGYSVTWATVAWPGGTAPTLTATASKKDLFSFFSDGTTWYGATIGQNY